MTVTTDQLRKAPLLSDLDERELAQIVGCFSLVSIPEGETLYSEGEPAKSACFLIKGELEAFTALPGGGETRVGSIGPGSMIGEMALMAGGSRTATVRAKSDAAALMVSCTFFQASLDQLSVPAYKILRRVTQGLSERLSGLQSRLIAYWTGEHAPPASAETDAEVEDPLAGVERDAPCSFDYRAFLPIVPLFRDFDEREIDLVVARAKVLELPRGRHLYREGGPARACYIVVRGALEQTVTRGERRQLAIFGPGRLCGANDLIGGQRHNADAAVRAGALLLEFDQAAFEGLFTGETTECLKFQSAIAANQLIDLKAADNLLTTLVSQAHVHERSKLCTG